MGKKNHKIITNKWEYRNHQNSQNKNKNELSNQLLKFFVCLLLFAVVFVGRGVFPGGMTHVRDELLALLTANTDFKAVFQHLGESICGDGNILRQADNLYREVFGIDSGEDDPGPVPQLTSLWSEEQSFLNSAPGLALRTSHYTQNSHLQFSEYREEENVQNNTNETDREESVPAAGTVLLHVDYGDQPLPEGYTMDQLSLGELETITPLVGRINSVYGYRDHPIDGRYQFHGGVDIGGQRGDSIRAFADGTVDYVGEDNSYGLYLQLDHGNGVKSFYAHCNSICVKKGQTIAKGEKIGEVGSSGSATGPHLHFELKYENTHIDPSYYIECLSSQ